MATKSMTGKEAHEYLIAARDLGGVEGIVEGSKPRRTMAHQWSELYREVDAVKRTDNVPTALVKRIFEAYPAEPDVPAAEAPTE